MSNPFDFGDVAVCEKCGVTLPASEACYTTRSIYRELGGTADITRTRLVVCPTCYRGIERSNAFGGWWTDSLGDPRIAGRLAFLGLAILISLVALFFLATR